MEQHCRLLLIVVVCRQLEQLLEQHCRLLLIVVCLQLEQLLEQHCRLLETNDVSFAFYLISLLKYYTLTFNFEAFR